MPALPEHTSAAQLALYATCPKKYKLRYIDEAEPEYKSVSMALGSAVHSAIGWWFEQKNAGREPTLDEVDAVVRADLTAATDEQTRYGKWTPEDLAQHAERLVRCFLEQYANLPVKQSEVRFELELYDPDTGEVLPRKMLGYLDFVLRDGRVVELKTARSAYSDIDVARSLQFAGYGLALQALGIGDELQVVVLVKYKVPRVQHVTLVPDERSERFFLRTATDIERAILAGHFPAAPGLGCSQCEYQKQCLGVGEAAHGEAA